jgi:enhancing lycopene biosynthesis protein 2
VSYSKTPEKTSPTKKIAVILCGSGFKDGSEIRESVGVLWALSRHAITVDCFALNAPQHDVVNCLTGEVVKETRNQLVESARIARGKIARLEELDEKNYDAIILPGGFGAAKNLCDFAMKGSTGTAHPLVQEKLQAFLKSSKPIGAVCIAPTIVALAIKTPLQLTLGASGEAAAEIEKLGHRHVVTPANDCCIDAKNKVVSTPAYMYDSAPLCDIFEGIRKLVDEVVKLT